MNRETIWQNFRTDSRKCAYKGLMYSILLVTLLILCPFYVSAQGTESAKGNFALKDEQELMAANSLRSAEYEDALRLAVAGADPDWSEFEKAMYAHDYICRICEYDYDYENYTAEAVFLQRRAVCQGYALAYMDLATELGLECSYVRSNQLNHAWNMVRIDGQYYFLDCTWDGQEADSGRVKYQYFLKSLQFYQSSLGAHASDDYEITSRNGETQSENLCSSTKYDAFALHSQKSGPFYMNNKWYGVDEIHGSVCEYQISQNNIVDCRELERVRVNGKPLCSATYKNRFFYSMGNAIYEFDLTKYSSSKVYELSTSRESYGDIYGIYMIGDTVEVTQRNAEGLPSFFSFDVSKLKAEDAGNEGEDVGVMISGTFGVNGENRYELNEQGVLKISGNDAWDSNLNWQSYPWEADEYRSKISRIVVEDGMNEIGTGAFYRCSNVKTVILADSVETIGASAFSECSQMENLDLSSGLEEIGDEAFCQCSRLTKLQLPESVKVIGIGAFRSTPILRVDISSLEKYMNIAFGNDTGIPTQAGAYLYLNNQLVRNLRVPSTVTQINPYTFYGCEYIETVDIPEGVESIGDNAFENCLRLKTVTFRGNVNKIGKKAFYRCKKLEKMKLPEGIDTIEELCFFGCDNLTDVTIPGSVSTIERGAFSCVPLSSIYIPAGVSSIASGAFEAYVNIAGQDYNHITRIEVAPGNANYNSKNGCNAIIETATETLLLGCKNTVIPQGVKAIGEHAFEKCRDLKQIELPDSLETLQAYAFSNCGIAEITIPDSVTVMEKGVFNGNPLESLVFPEGIKTLSTYLFWGDGALEYVVIPEGVNRIENGFLYGSGIQKIYYGGTETQWNALVEEVRRNCTYEDDELFDAKVYFQSKGPCRLEEHVYDQGEKSGGTSCLDPLYITYTCQICGYVLKEEQDVNLHKLTKHEAVESTCSSKGTMEYYECSQCMAMFADENGKRQVEWEDITKPLDAGNHPKDSLVITKGSEPTCTEAGWTESIWCSKCYTWIKERTRLDAKGHDYATNPAVEPTCSRVGYTEETYCKNCGHIDGEPRTELPKLKHKEAKKITKATLKANGKIVTYCTSCNQSLKTEKISRVKGAALSAASFVYTGKAITPKVTVTDTAGKKLKSSCYLISVKNNVKIGTATVNIKLKGNYSGTITKTFSICPKTTRISKLVGVKKGIKISWVKVKSNVDGYELQYATNKSFTKNTGTVRITSNGVGNRTITKLLPGKKYYVRIRTYKNVKKKSYYSGWTVYKNPVRTLK